MPSLTTARKLRPTRWRTIQTMEYTDFYAHEWHRLRSVKAIVRTMQVAHADTRIRNQ